MLFSRCLVAILATKHRLNTDQTPTEHRLNTDQTPTEHRPNPVRHLYKTYIKAVLSAIILDIFKR